MLGLGVGGEVDGVDSEGAAGCGIVISGRGGGGGSGVIPGRDDGVAGSERIAGGVTGVTLSFCLI